MPNRHLLAITIFITFIIFTRPPTFIHPINLKSAPHKMLNPAIIQPYTMPAAIQYAKAPIHLNKQGNPLMPYKNAIHRYIPSALMAKPYPETVC